MGLVIYCYVCRKIQYISSGVTIKSSGVTSRYVTPDDEVSHKMTFSAFRTTLRLPGTQ